MVISLEMVIALETVISLEMMISLEIVISLEMMISLEMVISPAQGHSARCSLVQNEVHSSCRGTRWMALAWASAHMLDGHVMCVKRM